MQFKPYYSITLIIALVSVSVYAQIDEAFWTNGGGDQLWTNPKNWDPEGVPLGVHVIINNENLPAPKITEDVIANRISVARDSDPDREVFGQLSIENASLTMVAKNSVLDGQLVVSASDWATGTLSIKNSTVTVPRDMDVSWRGTGSLNMYSGLLDVKGVFGLSNRSTSWSDVQLLGGVIKAKDLDWRDSSDSFQSMNITGGKLILEGDKTQFIRDSQDIGYLNAYADVTGGKIVVDYNDIENQTTVYATHDLNPSPADGSTIPPTKEVELRWSLLEHLVSGQLAKVDVYFTDDYDQLYYFEDPETMQVVSQESKTSVMVDIEPDKDYFWAVDTYIGSTKDPVIGPIFRFYIDQAPLAVDAGVDVLAVLQNGKVTGPLSGTLTGEGDAQSAAVEWSIVSEPDPENAPATIADPSSLTTTITLNASGEYEIKLSASQGNQKKSDTLTITVYDTPWITLTP